MTIPSAWCGGLVPPGGRLWVRMAWLIAGVGTGSSFWEITVATPWAARTERAETKAGRERPWVSHPTKRGPSIPCSLRSRQMASVMARMWSSLKEAVREEPRCPEVPKETRWAGSEGSGWRSV